ncbi:hypothetical protein [Pelagicoccus mobilis]|uniref:Uncharacterized protein n=1 Tax=Pelagicoccus mobilis TaxID=415221 RepID=A0A934RYZ4_9BACT|nr:hypothetical protein [Pelagicoccus mobilis]MBK1876093.1 hypothetical protein [Pelagicoccus mobilis]
MKKLILLASSLILTAQAAQANPDRFNYLIGTHSIGSNYQFTDKTRLVETAEVIQDMGSNIMKFRLGRSFSKRNSAGPNPGNYKTLTIRVF